MDQNLPTNTDIKNPKDQKQPSLIRITSQKGKLTKVIPVFIIALIIAAGVFSGLVLASRNKSTTSDKGALEEEKLSSQVKESLAQTFRDEAEGVIQKNDTLDKYAQGTHKLIRPGGESQTAYLTSSVLDLDEFVGKKVKVFGETFGSSQVGWLMDVGKVEEVN
ncbi:MAG: hypothetical protein UT84_C0056G0005 [Candidatus Curtissbacteria bacterium GW2011_GWA1_40_16]|uniref:Uncharacterized protein n=1 Tax=Candidatus Curtissbacteria bacterium GW2011_GWA1_40_16 TaxID=1618405 RepID=A0A0G0RD28_9BACT|nr:MAG: hypothetical protein UT84_C0056G0005 [Candidatus Curtissbacteria bacterium GW2011_GWA1_40_16]